MSGDIDVSATLFCHLENFRLLAVILILNINKNMKHLICILFAALISVSTFAQEKLTFSEVIPVENLNKADIYAALREWVATSYKSAQDVIQMDDKDAGIIICSALFEYSYGKLQYKAYEGVIKYTLKLQIKDGRFKAELSNIIHQNDKGNSPKCNLGGITTAELYTDKGLQKKFDNNVWNDIKLKSEEYAKDIFNRLKVAASEATPLNDASDDW